MRNCGAVGGWLFVIFVLFTVYTKPMPERRAESLRVPDVDDVLPICWIGHVLCDLQRPLPGKTVK